METRGTEEENTSGGGHTGEGDPHTIMKEHKEGGQKDIFQRNLHKSKWRKTRLEFGWKDQKKGQGSEMLIGILSKGGEWENA